MKTYYIYYWLFKNDEWQDFETEITAIRFEDATALRGKNVSSRLGCSRRGVCYVLGAGRPQHPGARHTQQACYVGWGAWITEMNAQKRPDSGHNLRPSAGDS